MNQSNVSIKELADELEVSKTAIRKHINQLRHWKDFGRGGYKLTRNTIPNR